MFIVRANQEMFKVFSTSRVKLDHYKEKVDSLQGKLMRKADAKLNEQLSRVRSACVCVSRGSLHGKARAQNRDKLRSAQEEYDRERERVCSLGPIPLAMYSQSYELVQFLLQLGETFENSMLHFEKLLVRVSFAGAAVLLYLVVWFKSLACS